MRQLLLNDLWPTVARLSSAATRVQAAIAYVSSAENLHLRSGDLLIADASNNAIKTGQTSAKVLQQFFKSGVAIYHCPGLHAKLLVIDGKLIVGSGNASNSSASKLLEAAVVTSDSRLVSQAQSFLYQLTEQSVALDATSLARLTQIKVQRRFFPSSRAPRRWVVARGNTTWLAMVRNIPETAFATEQRGIAKAERAIARVNPKAEPSILKFWGKRNSIEKRAENGDTICVGWARVAGGIPFEIEPPTSVLYKHKSQNCTLLFYDSELSRPLVPVKWREFQRLLKRAGIRPVKPTSVRAITADQGAELQRIWPRSR